MAYKLTNSRPQQTGYTGRYVELYTAYEADTLLANKQDTLTAGTNISISSNVIACTLALTDLIDDSTSSSSTVYSSEKVAELLESITPGTSYTAESPLSIDSNVISVTGYTGTVGGVAGSTATIAALTLANGVVQSVTTTTVPVITNFPASSARVLLGDNTWGYIDDTVTEDSANLVTSGAVYTAIENAPEYSAGDFIDITNKVISVSGLIDDSSADTTTTYSSSQINTLLGAKQDSLTAGDNITISSNVISANQIDDTATTSTVKALSASKIYSELEAKQDALTAGSNITITGTTIAANQIDDTSTSSTSTTLSASAISAIQTTLQTAINAKQAAITAASPLTLDSSGNLSLDNSGVTAGTYGAQNTSDGTLMPIIRVDAIGRVIDATTTAIYPPIDSGTTGQYWKSDGSGRGSWATPAQTLTDSTLAIPSSAAVLDYITSGSVTILTYQGDIGSEDEISSEPSAGWFYVANADFTFESNTVHHGDWLVYNHDTDDYDTNRWYIWAFGSVSAQSVNGYMGDIVLRGSDLQISSSDERTVEEGINEIETNIGDLTDLSTSVQDNLVAAINELASEKQSNLIATSPLVLEADTPEENYSTLSATFDSVLTEDSENFISSGTVYAETYADVKAYDAEGTEEHDVKIIHLTTAEYEALVEGGTVDTSAYYHITDDEGSSTTNLFSMFLGLYSYSPADWDTTPVESSTNPVTSGGIYTALQNVRNAAIQILTELPATGQTGTIYYVYDATSEGYYTYVWDEDNQVFTTVGSAALSLTMDSTPTANSSNAVTSGGIYADVYNAVKAYTNDGTGESGIKVVCLTQAQFDALSEKDEDTLYFVEEE